MTTKSRDNKIQPAIETDVDLSDMNTMGVTVFADRFVSVSNTDQLNELYNSDFFARRSPIILGGGSNMLFVNDPPNPVLKVSIRGIHFEDSGDKHVLLTAGAGENWHNLVSLAVKKGFGGIENLALIPGTSGAAPIQNIGAYGVELQDVFEKLTAFNTKSGNVETFTAKDCKFGYRDSIFKHEKKKDYIICSLSLRLTTSGHRCETSYKSLSDHLKKRGVNEPGIKDIFDAVVEIRRSKLPDPAKIGNAGSFFKNPVVTARRFNILQDNFPDLPYYKLENNMFKLPAAWFIDQTGWKGKRVGNVGSYKNQALVLVNLGGATGREIYNHAMRIKESVKQKFGVDLKPEVNIIGELN